MNNTPNGVTPAEAQPKGVEEQGLKASRANPSAALPGATSDAEPSGLVALLARVEAADGPDRYIDFWVTVLLWDPDPKDDIAALEADIELVGIEEMWVEHPFSASLDAVAALAQRLYPGASIHLRFGENYSCAHMSRGFGYARIRNVAPSVERGDDEAQLALLAALLKAKIAETGQ